MKQTLALVVIALSFDITCLNVVSVGDSFSCLEPSCNMAESQTTPVTSETCQDHVSAQATDSEPVRSSQATSAEERILSGQYIRSPLARAVYNKLREDERSKNDRHVYWYRVIVSRLPEDLQAKFVQFEQDEGTDEFLENCKDKSDHLFTQLFYSLARPVLNLFMTQTSINGLLNRGSMFIFSKPQFEKLLNFSPYHKREALLDLGAGDGMVTRHMSSYFHTTYTTEMSGMMVRRLTAQGFTVLDVDQWQTAGVKYDLIACLNLLDRCDKPLTLLAEIRAALKPDTGRVLVALVIPFKPYVEYASKTHQPTEFIHVKGSNFEEQVEHLESIFKQSGFEIERFSRMPYLCEGDLRHSFYVLSDAVFVLRPTNDGS